MNIGAVKIVNQFEELKLSLSAIAKLSDLDFKRNFQKYSINNNPEEVAKTVREKLYPVFSSNRRDFLKSLISKFAEKIYSYLNSLKLGIKKKKQILMASS